MSIDSDENKMWCSCDLCNSVFSVIMILLTKVRVIYVIEIGKCYKSGFICF